MWISAKMSTMVHMAHIYGRSTCAVGFLLQRWSTQPGKLNTKHFPEWQTQFWSSYFHFVRHKNRVCFCFPSPTLSAECLVIILSCGSSSCFWLVCAVGLSQAGTAAVQFTLAYGLTVLATGGTEEGREMLKKLGVKHVLNHHSDNYTQQVMVRYWKANLSVRSPRLKLGNSRSSSHEQ